jgi:hypothetical protein
MKQQSYDDQLITEYLLGSLTAKEAERLDELSFTDDAFAVALQAIENDLVDAYVRGELHGKVLERFRSFYLSSLLRQEKVNTAKAFLEIAGREGQAQRRASEQRATSSSVDGRRADIWWKEIFALPKSLGLAAIAASILLFIGLGWMVVQNQGLRKQQQANQAELELLNRKIADMQAEVAKQQATTVDKQQEIDGLLARLEQRSFSEEPNIVPIALEPQTRGISAIGSVAIPSGSDFLTLQLALESNDHPTYQATLKSLPSGEILWRRSGLTAQQRGGAGVIVITVRASILKSQNYLVELSVPRKASAEAISSYVFKAVKE